MTPRILIAAFLIFTLISSPFAPAEEFVRLRGDQVELVWATAGGALVSFRFLDAETNPLNFEVTPDIEQRRDDSPLLRGHFVCLDRWGAPSKAEETHGVPFHGEAPRVEWKVDQPPAAASARISAEMSCTLPLAGMRVKRHVELDPTSSVALVTEQITNTNHLARIYNLVQHPSIAPPFLHDGTLVDSNAGAGFNQEGAVPDSQVAADRWPNLSIGGSPTDLRRFRDGTDNRSQHDVSSFVFSANELHGWVTACSPRHKLLLGYVWRTAEYPWLNVWRYRREGKVAARGLEFGTTGYHQPFPALVRQRQILDRQLFEPLDADETAAKSYLCFLARVPDNFQGVATLQLDAAAIRIRERRDVNPFEIELRTAVNLPKRAP